MLTDPISEGLGVPAIGEVICGRKTGLIGTGILLLAPAAGRTPVPPTIVNGTCKRGLEADAVGMLLLTDFVVIP